MITAKNNIIVKIDSSKNDEYAILNPVSGSFDLMGEKEYLQINEISNGKINDKKFADYLIERGYAYESISDQEKAIDEAYEDFNKEILNSQVQLMLVPTYGCNLSCSYCFQQGVESKLNLIKRETVDSFFKYANDNFSSWKQKPFITLFGGEPLVNSNAQKNITEYIVNKCIENDYELSIVTNGYDFIHYVDILKKARIKEIQFTLDGSRKIHDSRRATAGKKGTFDRIIAGIEKAVENKMPVNLRSVFDSENIEDIRNLAEFVNGKGWLDLPPGLFKTQIGRNYELFECYAKPQHLLAQTELWGKFISLSRKYPVIAKYHRPDFKGIRNIIDEERMYMASFDTCPAAKTEWVFDLYGDIYGCTAGCGRKEYRLGTFWPEVELDMDVINTWKSRDVKHIQKCNDCQYDVICGGGCGVIAANKNNGDILSPDCRPVKDLIDMGVNYYIKEIKEMAEETVEDIQNSTQDFSFTDSSVSLKNKKEGCVICGEELVYSGSISLKETCSICNKQFESYVRCRNGHYVCDDCHGLNILEKIENILARSNKKDPLSLAGEIFSLSELNIHGPEYHSIVPAVIIAAYYNNKDNISPDIRNKKISEAIKRGKGITGGSCGFYGACGAGIGAGIAISLIENATPITPGGRQSANNATADALKNISRFKAARCCKRDSLTAVESFIDGTDYFKDINKTRYVCSQSEINETCIRKQCPYYSEKSYKN